ncbi:MAG: glycosyltransferase [Maribacter litoralis]|uniref:glycosyltransferase n=1 Tax=Maribacter litoralis TaxID=2059726 RepID=UPI0032970474
MRILQVIASMNPKHGGVCQGIRNTVPELQKMGVESEVVCLDDPNSDYLGQDAFVIHALGKSKKLWGYHKDLIPWLLSNFSKYDVVVVNGLWLYQSHAAIKAMLAYRKTHDVSPKVYVMTHGMLDPYFQTAKDRKLKALRNKLYWKVLENKVVNEADGILFTCEEELLLARTTFPNYKPKREINVGYGIQPPPANIEGMREAFASHVPDWNSKPFLLFLSRIHPKKGVDMLINAYRKLEEEFEEVPQLIIAGPNEHEYGKEMQTLGADWPNIIFSGMLSGDAKWGAFHESETFVLSSHQENFGIAVVEALACSKPVLISNKVNIWREIEKGKGGIVKSDSQDDTYQLLKEWILLNQKEKNQMSLDAGSVYQAHFTISSATEKYLQGINN